MHGLGATHDMMLAQYEQHFAAAGIATLAFDYRYTGESDGQPRQHISMARQREDVDAALAFLAIAAGRRRRTHRSVGHQPRRHERGARRRGRTTDVAAAVVQCPIVHGPGRGAQPRAARRRCG